MGKKKPSIIMLASAIVKEVNAYAVWQTALEKARALAAAFSAKLTPEERIDAGKQLRSLIIKSGVSRVRAWEILKPYGFIAPRNNGSKLAKKRGSKAAKRAAASEVFDNAAEELVATLRKQYRRKETVAAILNRAAKINRK